MVLGKRSRGRFRGRRKRRRFRRNIRKFRFRRRRRERRARELNRFNSFEANFAVPTTGATVDIISSPTAGITQGTGTDERIGNRIKLTGLQMQLNFRVPPATWTDYTAPPRLQDQLELFLTYDRFPNNTVAIPNAIWDTPGVGAFRNLNNTSRIKIIWRKSFRISAKTSAAGAGAYDGVTDQYSFQYNRYESLWTVNVFKRLSIPVKYKMTSLTGADGQIELGQLKMYCFSKHALVELQPTFRTTFIDV